MDKSEVEILKRALQRERSARKQAEKILEQKSAELYHITQELQSSNEQLELLISEKTSELNGVFENIVDAYVVTDLKGNVLKMNDAAIELLEVDLNKESVNLMRIAHPEEFKNILNYFKELIKKGALTDIQVRIITKSKTLKLVHINCSVIYDIDGKPRAMQGIVRDITDLKNLEKQKELLLSQLERSNDELHEYAHIVSHDLKSPLRSIDALVNWLKIDNLEKYDEVSLKNISLIEETLEKMEQLIGDILDYSSLNSNHQKIKIIDCDVLVKDLIKTLYVPEHITINIENPLPKIKADSIKINQLFQNLLSNAVKFIDKEHGLIEVNHEELETHYLFKIKDNGIGIDPKFHKKIFKIFHSLNKSKNSTGIGLSIVKKIVDLHQGKIWIESEKGKGSTFCFTLKK